MYDVFWPDFDGSEGFLFKFRTVLCYLPIYLFGMSEGAFMYSSFCVFFSLVFDRVALRGFVHMSYAICHLLLLLFS